MADATLPAAAHNATQAASGAPGLSGTGSVHGAVQAAPEAIQGAAQGVVQGAVPGAAASAAPAAATPGTGEAVSQAATAAQTAAQAAGLPSEAVFSWGGYFQAIGVLLLLLAILWGVVWLVRKYGKFNFLPQPGALPRDALRMEAQLPLGPRRSLVVVRFLNKRLLLGVTDHQINLLQETGNHNEHDSMDFQDVMEEAQRRKPDV